MTGTAQIVRVHVGMKIMYPLSQSSYTIDHISFDGKLVSVHTTGRASGRQCIRAPSDLANSVKAVKFGGVWHESGEFFMVGQLLMAWLTPIDPMRRPQLHLPKCANDCELELP